MAEGVLPLVAWLAEKSAARVTLLHVIEPDAPPVVHGDPHLALPEPAREYLQELAGRSFPAAVKVDWHVHSGEVRDVAHGVADHTDELAPDLVVMSSHGEHLLRNWWIGSLPQLVAGKGRAPVLVIAAGLQLGSGFPFRHILVPLDGRPEHESGIEPAASMAELCSASMLLLTVIPTAADLSGPHAATGSLLPTTTRVMLDLGEDEAVRYLQDRVQELQSRNLLSRGKVVRGDPVEVITGEAARMNSDLLVLGTHGRSGMRAFWEGSMARRLFGRIAVSFLLVPADQHRVKSLD